LNAIPQSHQPTEITRFTWLYTRVKKCKLLQRHIDCIRDSRENSHCRSWDWLMNQIKAVLVEVREDANEESIRASLRTKAKPKQDAKAAVAQNRHDQETTKGLPNPSSKPKGLRQSRRRVRSQRQVVKGRRVGKMEPSQRPGTQSAKEKVEVLKLRRMLRQSQRRSPRTVAKLPHHVSSGQKAHATGGKVVRFFMILKPNQQRSQRRRASKCKGNSCSSCCSRRCIASIIFSTECDSRVINMHAHLEVLHSCDCSSFLCTPFHHFQLCSAAGVDRLCSRGFAYSNTAQ